MLHKETVEERTFELLVKLMQDDYLADFFLVGGTALSLQLGHRRSVDIDLFTRNPFDVLKLRNHLANEYGFESLYESRYTLKGTVDGVFVDCIRHDYSLIRPLCVEDDIRMSSIHDIAAMKLNAIVDNGTRMKDFVDVAKILEVLNLEDIIDAYVKKYGDTNRIIVKKALTYFGDVIEEPIMSLDENYTWEGIKKMLKEVVMNNWEI